MGWLPQGNCLFNSNEQGDVKHTQGSEYHCATDTDNAGFVCLLWNR